MSVDLLLLEKLLAALPLTIDELRRLGNVTAAVRAQENQLVLLRNQMDEMLTVENKARAKVEAELAHLREEASAAIRGAWDKHERQVEMSNNHAQAELTALGHQKQAAETERDALRKEVDDLRNEKTKQRNELTDLHSAKTTEAVEYAETRRKHAEFRASVGL